MKAQISARRDNDIVILALAYLISSRADWLEVVLQLLRAPTIPKDELTEAGRPIGAVKFGNFQGRFWKEKIGDLKLYLNSNFMFELREIWAIFYEDSS